MLFKLQNHPLLGDRGLSTFPTKVQKRQLNMVITYSSSLVVTVHHLIITMCEKSFRLPCLGAVLFHSALMHFVLDHIGCIRVELLYSTFIRQPP